MYIKRYIYIYIYVYIYTYKHVQRESVKRNSSQTDQAGKYFLLTSERAFCGREVESRNPELRHVLGQMRSRSPTP